MNEILLESQKMIYAPPSREKSKQTVRSPMLADRQGVGAVLNTNTLSNGTDSEYVINGAHYGGS